MKLDQDEKLTEINEVADNGRLDSDEIGRLATAVVAQGWMRHADAINVERLVSSNELTSLSALIAYVAHMLGDNEFGVERLVADRFSVPNVKCLPSTRFDEAIRYLVDQVPVAAGAV